MFFFLPDKNVVDAKWHRKYVETEEDRAKAPKKRERRSISLDERPRNAKRSCIAPMTAKEARKEFDQAYCLFNVAGKLTPGKVMAVRNDENSRLAYCRALDPRIGNQKR